MNRKIRYIVLLLLCTAGVYAAKSEGPEGAHPWNLSKNENGVAEKFAHWTISLDAGFNAFDGDFNYEMKHPVWVPTVGLALEYNFTPMWMLGIGYNFDMYRVTGQNNNQHADLLLDGHMHRAQIYGGFDLMSACYPKAMKKIFGLDLFIGGGATWWKNNIYFGDETKGHTASFEPMKDEKYNSAKAYVMAGLSFYFNLGRVTSLGVKGTYSYFVADVIDGRGTSTLASKNNDGLFDVTLNLRFKLACKKKTHVKNISSYAVFDKMNAKQREKDTLVINHVDTLYMIQEGVSAAAVQVAKEYEYAFIYFEHNENDLNEKALIDVQQLATRMKNDQSICIEIIGYADNTGTDEYNKNLGYARAQNIRDELVEEHFISPDRITYSSGGIIHGGRSEGAYTPNRRADIKIMNCDNEFQDAKRVNDENNAKAEAEHSQAMADRENGVITAPEGLTLSGIARKYYGNTYCWVFIYEANRTTLKNPNYIPPQTRLVIPDLTQEQRNISKKRAEAYFEKIK